MSAKRRAILMLGGSQQQVVAIERAKELGFRTVLCDYLSDNPGQYYADVFYRESTTDRDRVLEIARSEGVSGVLAYSSDPASPTAGYVAEVLGLPSNPLAAIETMSDKHLFRGFLNKMGFSCPKNVSFKEESSVDDVVESLKNFNFPLVVKPTDSSGSKGVTVLDDMQNVELAIKKAIEFSRNGILICEEYIRKTFPHVVGGDIFVFDGKVRFWGLMSCLRDERVGGLVPVGKALPSGLSSIQSQAVKDVLQRLVTALGIKIGELNVEVIIGENGTPYVLELGSRAGGNMIPLQLSDASGIDLLAANVLCAMGDNPGDITWDSSRCETGFATYVLHSNIDGVFRGVWRSNQLNPHVYREVLYKNPGDIVESFDGANKAIGIDFFKFEDITDMNRILENVSQEIHPIVVASDGLLFAD